MARHEIKYLYRRSESRFSLIEYIGGDNRDGTQWKLTVERAIMGIETGRWEFFITINGVGYDVFAFSDSSEKYLIIKTTNSEILRLDHIPLS